MKNIEEEPARVRYQVTDVERSIRFYVDLLGSASSRRRTRPSDQK